jgi:IrrE N-terminal-like domain
MTSYRQLAVELRLHAALDEDQPLDVAAVATRLGCRMLEAEIAPGHTVEGELRPYRSVDRFQVRVDPTPQRGWRHVHANQRSEVARHRFRFRACHELGHTYFFDRCEGVGPKRKYRGSLEEESWCDEFARELLVPRSYVAKLPTTAESVFTIQGKFDVSLEVAARALAASQSRTQTALWFWLPETRRVTGSLISQWASATKRGLRSWRDSKLIHAALLSGEAAGQLPDLVSGKSLAASARCDPDRRQLVAVGQR